MMIGKRLLYLAVLIAALLLMVYTDTFFTAFLLAAIVALPVVSLLVSLPGMLNCQVRLEADAAAVGRGGQANWRVTVETRRWMPLSRVILRLQLTNAMTGERAPVTLRLYDAFTARSLFLPAITNHCGMLTCHLSSCRVCDGMGLFSIRRQLDVSAILPVMPLEAPDESLPELPCTEPDQTVLRARRGGGSGEDYDLRPYRPGDPVRLIHWKLSSKRDELVFREVLEAETSVPLLTFDHVGTPAEMDGLLDRLYSLCCALLEAQREHVVCWLHPETGAVREFRVSGDRELRRCFQAILEDPAPLAGHRLSEEPKAISVDARRTRVHLEPEQEGMV